MIMPAGTYYVGDLCYVIKNGEWDEVVDLNFPNSDSRVNGEFVLKSGVKIANFGTAYGDGRYQDQDGKEYHVDSGSIGCILLSDINTKIKGVDTSSGHIHLFEEDFNVHEYDGLIIFGHLAIDTSGTVINDEEDEDDEYDEYDGEDSNI